MVDPRVDAAVAAALQAAAVCRQVQQNLDQVRAMTKDDRSPVTVADYASQAVVCAVLRERLGAEFDDSAMVAEESGDFLRRPDHAAYRAATLEAVQTVLPSLDQAELLSLIDRGGDEADHGRFWTLDPVDGTKGFLRGQQYAIALALVEDGVPTLGVLACPNLPLDPTRPLEVADPVGALYVGVKDRGVEERACVQNGPNGSRRLPPLAPLGERAMTSCASVEKAHSSVSDTDRLLAHLGANPDVVRLDSSCKYAVVARGQADAYLRLPTRADYVERIWDHAAGVVVATEAGALVTDVRGARLDFSHGRGLEQNRGVIVARPGAHEAIVQGIADLGIGAR